MRITLRTYRSLFTIIVFSFGFVSGQASADDTFPPRITENYPRLSGGARDVTPTFNRAMWWFNYDIMDHYVLRPVAHGYVNSVPEPFRKGVSNVLDNLDEPRNVVNNIFVGQFVHSGASLARFSLNSTVGLLGIFDIASPMGIEQHDMSFSTVLGKAAVTQGPYFMVPVAGPMTLRSGIGAVVDNLYWPYSYMSTSLTIAKFVVSGIDSRAKLIERESIIDNAIDPYITTRDFYLQYEEAKVQGKDMAHLNNDAATDEEVDKYLDEIDYQ